MKLWHDLPGYYRMPEDVFDTYRRYVRKRHEVRSVLKNPVKGDGTVYSPNTINRYKSKEKDLTKDIGQYKILIKRMVKYHILPPSDGLDGKKQVGFIFTLAAMAEFPFLSNRVVFPMNQLARMALDEEPGEEFRKICFETLETGLELTLNDLRERKPYFLFTGQAQGGNAKRKTKQETPGVVSIADYRKKKKTPQALSST